VPASSPAKVHRSLADHKLARLEAVAMDIMARRRSSRGAQLAALDELAVRQHTDEFVKKARSVDVSFNVISIPHAQGKPLVEQRADDFALADELCENP
jgi:hypothetical protein